MTNEDLNVQVIEETYKISIEENNHFNISGINKEQDVLAHIDEQNLQLNINNTNSAHLTISSDDNFNTTIVEENTHVTVSPGTTNQITVSPQYENISVNLIEQTTSVQTVQGTASVQLSIKSGEEIQLVGDVQGGTGQNIINTELTELSPDPSGTYSSANIEVDSKGRVISASSGTSGSTSDVNRDVFTVQNDGEEEWSISTAASTILAVFINQIDYSIFCSLDTNTGTITYSDSVGGYVTETNDSVVVLWK